ncbi:hypothetical protein [Actinomadura alba]|uniref:Uncharacterized protein n=1 Tax=Actinomadura alba TaxID=406431 RepID=A0ABR7LLA4_9ACTN|nr:hypothetical protein [Actinomadura alba]MBC6465267.1 hypothetical protein [Actinomadura alba]
MFQERGVRGRVQDGHAAGVEERDVRRPALVPDPLTEGIDEVELAADPAARLWVAISGGGDP